MLSRILMIAYLSYGDVFDDFAMSRVIPNNYFLYVYILPLFSVTTDANKIKVVWFKTRHFC